jgi:hypothetical protein
MSCVTASRMQPHVHSAVLTIAVWCEDGHEPRGRILVVADDAPRKKSVMAIGTDNLSVLVRDLLLTLFPRR